jgi:RHS repeat-associated protein
MDRRVASTAVSSPLATASERLAYDHLSNLVATFVTAPGPLGAPLTTTTRLVYNAEHNRLLRAERSNGLAPSLAYAYDAAGFVTRQTARIGTSRFESQLDWNALGKIRSIATNGALDASFVYDALGRRRERFAGGVLTRWRFAGVVEADASDRPVAIELGALRIQLDGAHRYRHADARGNTKLVSDAAGAVVAHAAFSAYGRSAGLGSASSDTRFAGGDEIAVGVVRLSVLGQRLYDPALARFLAPDPIWSPLNQYAYTLGNPVDFWDASGMHAGRHTGLVSAGIDVASRLLGVGLAVVAFAVAATPTASAIAVVGGALALLSLAQGMAEFQEQLQRHREQTEAERREREGRAPPDAGGAGEGAGGLSGWGGGRDFELRPEPTRVVCATDFSGTRCTRSGANISISHRLWLY